MIIKEKQFICRLCGKPFTLKARKAYYCESCGKKKRSRDVMVRRKANNPNVRIGVGSGGNQRGTKNHRYIDGLSHYRDNYRRLNPEIRCCEICSSQAFTVVHHIDKDRRNNSPDNLIMLCRSCHAKVHRLAASLGSTPTVDLED
jgi:hypothetical protein